MIRLAGFTSSLVLATSLGLAALGLALAPASAEVLRARYAVSLVGLHIGEAAAVGSIESGKYRIDFSAHLTGVAAMVADVKMALTSTGALRKGLVFPATYATTSAIRARPGRSAWRSTAAARAAM